MAEAEGKLVESKPPLLMRAPLLSVASALIVGVWAGWAVALPITVWLAIGGVAVLLGVGAIRCDWPRPVLLGAMLVAVAAVGAGRMHAGWYSLADDDVVTFTGYQKTLVVMRGRVASFPVITQPDVEFGYRPDPKMTFLLDVHSLATDEGPTAVSGVTRVTVRSPESRYPPGAIVEITGWLTRPRPPSNPGQYDRLAAARTHGLLTTLTAPAPSSVTVLSHEAPSWIWRWRALVRQHLLEGDATSGGQITTALILGERSPNLRKAYDAMRRAGIAHLLAISGLHLGIFLLFVYGVCLLLRLRPRACAAIVLVVLGFYLCLAEPRPSLLRSATMATCLAAGMLIRRRANSFNSLSLAVILLLWFDPRQLMQAGFQLSFVVVFGLFVFNAPVQRILFGRWLNVRGLLVFRNDQALRRWVIHQGANAVINLISVSVTAFLVAAPLVAYWFGMFSPYGIVLSILILPLVVAILIPGYISAALVWVAPNLSSLFARVAGSVSEVLSGTVMAMEKLPCLSIELRPVSATWVVVWFAALTSVAWAVDGSRWRKGVAGVAVVLLIGMSVWSQRTITPPAGAIELVMLDIGSGQCIVLQDESGKTILLDAGTRNGYDAFGTILSPFLRSQHWPAPTTAVVSHANTDHYNLLGELARDGSLRTLAVCSYFADGTHADAVARGFLKLARECGVTQSTWRTGDRITRGDQTTIDVLWPVPGLTDVSENDTSLVLKLTHRGQRVLFPGDIGDIPQRALLAHPERIQADVLVLPHHGAWQKSLPEFIAAVNPSVILVSAARDPSGPSNAKPAVGEFYQDLKRNYRYRSTANSGAIRLTLTEDGIQIRSMR